MFLNPGGEDVSLSPSSRSKCKHFAMTQKYRWKRVEYSFIFHVNLLLVLSHSAYCGVVSDVEFNFKTACVLFPMGVELGILTMREIKTEDV
jgi:hypothetical protein